MAEKPILLSTPMVVATLAGRKTQTRRVCKEIALCDFEWGLDREPYIGNYRTFTKVAKGKWDWVTLENVWLYNIQTKVDDYKTYLLKPKYQPGDHLWVRETWCKDANGDYIYRANYGTTEDDSFPHSMFKWRPSIHMPREAARLFLQVVNVRVERVQDITPDDARAEGHPQKLHLSSDPRVHDDAAIDWFRDLWDALNFKRGYGWEVNPWVFAYTFEVMTDASS